MLGIEIALILMQQNGEVKVENDEQLPDDCQLTEVPEIRVVVVHVTDEHEAVGGKKHAQMALL